MKFCEGRLLNTRKCFTAPGFQLRCLDSIP